MSKASNGLFAARTLPWLLLALSLALNAFFVGGHLYTDAQLQQAENSAAERARLVAARLELDPAQTAAFRTMRGRIEAAREDYDSASAKHVDVIWNELAEPEPDMAVVEEQLDRFWDSRKTLLKTNLSAASDFLDQLSHDQRREFISLSRQAKGAPIGTKMHKR